MKKATIAIVPNKLFLRLMGNMYDYIECSELIELIKLDFENESKTVVTELTLKPGIEPKDVPFPKNIELIEVFGRKDNKFICLFRSFVVPQLKPFVKMFKLDLIWEKPSYATKEEFVISCTGKEKEQRKLISVMKLFGEIKSISVKEADYKGTNPLSGLTDRQKEIFLTARGSGYYDYPKKIDSDSLAEKLNITRPTLIEHLRKAEKKIFANITV